MAFRSPETPALMSRIYLSKADVTEAEEHLVLDAVRSGWVAPLGPHVDAFEAEMASRVGVKAALAVSSGTAALHLALLGVGAAPGTVVLCPTLTFAASANAIVYTGATPVFVDAVDIDGNVDADLMLDAADELQADGVTVAAALVVDLFGRCADYHVLVDGFSTRGIPIVEDAAESLGATFHGEPAGSFGQAAALSFNGNKIMTTSGGGMLLSNDSALIGRARYLSTQARLPANWYEHSEVGYNYRLSNVLAALGRAQLVRLDSMIARRRSIRAAYIDGIGSLPGVRFIGGSGIDDIHQDNCWLSTIILDSRAAVTATDLIARMTGDNIEVRHLWKPMHLQPAFANHRAFVTGQAEAIFTNGVALPSGSSLRDDEVSRVLASIRTALGGS